ncbi:septum formation initiator family protein [Thermocrinis sp.]|jgi:cell division protein FtsB|uniref:FtsB family cell division protein n=1 Tax=Thermocrinis sp. TaxID=2024383 RepID=UPI0026214533|nr:septum formation initiator family protein [Thermocrinis sp.]
MREGLWAKRNSGGSRADRLALLFFLLMLFFTGYNLLYGRYNLMEIKKMKDNMGELDKKLKALKNENMKLEEELDLAEKDLDFQLEKLVREKMQLQRPNEKILLFKE